MNYTCILKNGSRRETWTGQILLLDAGDGWYEAEINGRGTYFHILAGRHKYGNYLCVPNHDVGCELSDFSDIFWNEERIGVNNFMSCHRFNLIHCLKLSHFPDIQLIVYTTVHFWHISTIQATFSIPPSGTFCQFSMPQF